MRYRAECISGYTDMMSPVFSTEEEAYDWLEAVSCRMGTGKPCESCQAEWMVIECDDTDVLRVCRRREQSS